MYRIRNTNKTKHRSIYIQNQYNKQNKNKQKYHQNKIQNTIDISITHDRGQAMGEELIYVQTNM